MLLAHREYGVMTEIMDYTNVPTVVFTPLEYGSVGLSEEDAQLMHGKDAISTYHTEFTPLEWAINKTSHGGNRVAYVKVLVKKDTDMVVGYHVCAPNAGEITQGIGIAFQCGLTKKNLDKCVGIHPTVAEDCIGLTFTKESNPNASKSGC
jgi:pyruvate/2-oxoglutarate dehydrogenase complex dihydrolipoamide dehydrogenase (E3) component